MTDRRSLPDLPPDFWDFEPPAGWEPVAALCGEMFDRRDAIVEQIVGRIVDEVDEYRSEGGPIRMDELRWTTGLGVAGWLRGFATRDPMTDEAVAYQRFIGRQSARNGLPLQPVVASYQIGFRELWAGLAGRAQGTKASELMLEHGSVLWERLVEITNAIADGYQAEVARQRSRASSSFEHLLQLLERGASDDEASQVAFELGFDPSAVFTAAALADEDADRDLTNDVCEAVRRGGHNVLGVRRGRTGVLLAQAQTGHVEGAVGELEIQTPLGVGSTGAGLDSAAVSLSRARRALELAKLQDRMTTFASDWLTITVLANHDEVGDVLDVGTRIAESNPHLAEAVSTFGAERFNVARASRRLFISPNALRYRLQRWHDLTGWNPLHIDGLAASVLAIRLRSDAQDHTPDP